MERPDNTEKYRILVKCSNCKGHWVVSFWKGVTVLFVCEEESLVE